MSGMANKAGVLVGPYVSKLLQIIWPINPDRCGLRRKQKGVDLRAGKGLAAQDFRRPGQRRKIFINGEEIIVLLIRVKDEVAAVKLCLAV